MLFNSLSYAVFLPIVFILYWTVSPKWRWLLLLTSSYYFYMSWNVKYVVLIATTTIVSYVCALSIDKTEDLAKKRLFLFLALIVSLGILFIFKYYNFTIDVLGSLFHFRRPYLKVLLPVGISFYTFQTLSYVIDVYRGDVNAERNLGVYATFVSFFPQLVAGPIERTSNLLPQIRTVRSFNYEKACYGIRLIIWGLYKKVVIADNIAIYVDAVYGDVTAYKGMSLIVATLFFAIQIYCDFSGYSDIARGSAMLMNIEIMQNFKSPYFSSSIQEFWSRWHISLSTWFRDYVYIPLGGNRVSGFRNAINLMITFLISGLWHGANITFVVWGGVHGFAQILEKKLPIKKRNKRDVVWAFRVIMIFLLVMFSWVFFRANTISDANYIFGNMFVGSVSLREFIKMGFKALGISKKAAIKIILIYFIPLVAYDYVTLNKDINEAMSHTFPLLKWGSLILQVLAILIFGYVGTSSFVYFQF